MADRLRDLIDLVLDSPVALRRRLLLERAAWQLRTGAATASEAASAADYGSLAAFSRAFARRVRDGGAWDDAFVDALCEPPQSFTYGGVIAHVLTYGAIRREALAGVLAELGAAVPDTADPILWEMARQPLAAPGGA